MTRPVVLATGAVLLVLAAAAIADVALNPEGTHGVVFGKLFLRPTPGKPGLNFELLAPDPPGVEEGDFYCVDDVGQHGCCYQTDTVPFCWGATPQPTKTPTPTFTPTQTFEPTQEPNGQVRYVFSTPTPTPP